MCLWRNALSSRRPGFIVADDADRKHVDAQVGEIIYRIGAAAGDDGAFAMFEDEYGRFARDAGDFAEDKFVGHQVAENGDGDFGEGFDDLLEALGF